MKKYLVAAYAFLTLTGVSMAGGKNLVCEGGKEDLVDLKLEAASFSTYLYNVTATVSYVAYPSNRKAVELGKKDHLKNDTNYRPIRYKGYNRFDLSNLVNPSTFGDFWPKEDCHLLVHFPANAEQLSKFTAPVLAHCDQHGGKFIMTCTQDIEGN